jgi:ICP0-binding domain of Ubiquitin-specific protease 7
VTTLLPCLQEEGVRLELLGTASYDEIVSALAAKLQLDSPAHLRLTQHNTWQGGPGKRQYKWNEDITLDKVLPNAAGSLQVVYYEVCTLAHNIAAAGSCGESEHEKVRGGNKYRWSSF